MIMAVHIVALDWKLDWIVCEDPRNMDVSQMDEANETIIVTN